VVCLIAGIPLAAYGLSGGGALFAIVGLALVLVFWSLAWQWITRAGKRPRPSSRQPTRRGTCAIRHARPHPFSLPASEGGEKDDGASRRGSE